MLADKPGQGELVAAPHAAAPEEVLESLDSTRGGLDDAEARGRLERFGPNVLQRAQGDGPLRILLRQVQDPLIYILIAAAALAVATGKVVDGLVIFGVVVINTLIGFIQEYRAGKAIEALIDMVPETATVLRDGERRNLPASELVPGDVVELQSGDKVPADMRILQLRNLRVEEAALTGESVPVEKEAGVLSDDTPLADRKNMVELAAEITRVAQTCREGRITPADLQGGTFTVTNLGRIGGSHFTPIVNDPEAAILGMGRAAEHPVVVDGTLGTRVMLPLSLSYDHRLIDGADAAAFTNWIAEAIAEPLLLSLEG